MKLGSKACERLPAGTPKADLVAAHKAKMARKRYLRNVLSIGFIPSDQWQRFHRTYVGGEA